MNKKLIKNLIISVVTVFFVSFVVLQTAQETEENSLLFQDDIYSESLKRLPEDTTEMEAIVYTIHISLNVFESVHGSKPKVLDELVPDYLPYIPLHPDTGVPITIEQIQNTDKK